MNFQTNIYKSMMIYRHDYSALIAFIFLLLIRLNVHAQLPEMKRDIRFFDDFSSALDTTKWFVEISPQKGNAVTVQNKAMVIDVNDGATVWFKHKLNNAWIIEFDRTIPMQGGANDRLSDFNVFWQATDPHTGKLLGRNPDFKNYNSLRLYYVGFGGNKNTTTRFRKYKGTGNRDVIQEYTDKAHLLEANKTYHCRIVFNKNITSFYVNDVLFFTYKDENPFETGYFGFRTLNSRQIIDNFRVYNRQYGLIYANERRLNNVKTAIAKKNNDYTTAYKQLIKEANKALLKKADPVVNKTQMPPSGDKHDYLSLAPYFWPDSTKTNGLPWMRRDGQVNPLTRGLNTDQTRLSELFEDLEHLNYAYFFSGETKYATKAKELIEVWFIDPQTKVNPNVNFGQSVPGMSEGRPAGIIEWTGTAHLITAMQLLSQDKLMADNDKKTVDTWIGDYVQWLLTSSFGVKDDKGDQNHANWYDFQVVGILRYLGRDGEAKKRVEAAKINRIAAQIEPDGAQPKELSRTKSISYSDMNLRAMMNVAELGRPLGVDLFTFATPDGRSLKKAFEYLKPFTTGEKKWMYQQITPGDINKAIDERLKPLFSIGSTIMGKSLIDDKIKSYEYLSYLQKLLYPPLDAK